LSACEFSNEENEMTKGEEYEYWRKAENGKEEKE